MYLVQAPGGEAWRFHTQIHLPHVFVGTPEGCDGHSMRNFLFVGSVAEAIGLRCKAT